MTPKGKAPSTYETENNTLSNWRPIHADPTPLTTQQLLREISSLKELWHLRMESQEKAVMLLQAFTDRQPTIAEVVAKFEEKFRGIDAVIAKSEAATTKQIDAIVLLLQANTKAVDDKIDDAKNRLTSIEGHGQAYSRGFGFIATGIGIIAAIAGAFAALFIRQQ